MARLTKDLPDVVAEKVDDRGRPIKGDDDKVMTKRFSGQAWRLAGSDPATNGGWDAKAAPTPTEIAPKPRKTAAAADDDVIDVSNKLA